MNKKRIVYGICSVVLVLVTFSALGIFWDSFSEKADDAELLFDGPPSVCWDGKLYQEGAELEEDAIRDFLGKITEVVDLTESPKKHGQSNTLEIPVGSEIYATIYGNDLAVCDVDGNWRYLRYVREQRE